MQFIVTKANADTNGRVINRLFEEYAAKHSNVRVYNSLGLIRYLSAVKHADMIIGNSSSGLIEVPSFHIPTINIGDRQKGRLKADSVIDCAPLKEEICNAIIKAESAEMRKLAACTINPYGDGNTTDKVLTAIKKMFENGIDLKKKFYDLEFTDNARM